MNRVFRSFAHVWVVLAFAACASAPGLRAVAPETFVVTVS
jgi:hypothetical protein